MSSLYHEKINYIELPSSNIAATKAFYASVFGWEFTDYGPDYTAFANAGVDGGFYLSELASTTELGSALVVLYSSKLESTQKKVVEGGGKIVKDIFHFPGGRRFHFVDTTGNELAVWSNI